LKKLTEKEAPLWVWFAANAPKTRHVPDGKLIHTNPNECAKWADDMLLELYERIKE